MSDLAFLKLGGSLLTDKRAEKAFRPDQARSAAREIRQALAEGGMRLVLGHGAGCFGHIPASRWHVSQGLPASSWEGFARTRRSVMELNALVLDAFAAEGLFPVFVQPSAVSVARGGALHEMDLKNIERLLAADQVPMVCGDAVLDETQGFAIVGTEGFFAYMAERLRPSRIVLACDVDGVRDADPRLVSSTKRIERIGGDDLEALAEALVGTGGVDVTGGMAGKVRALHAMASNLPGTETRIVSGLLSGQVRDALLGGGGGTLVVP